MMPHIDRFLPPHRPVSGDGLLSGRGHSLEQGSSIRPKEIAEEGLQCELSASSTPGSWEISVIILKERSGQAPQHPIQGPI